MLYIVLILLSWIVSYLVWSLLLIYVDIYSYGFPYLSCVVFFCLTLHPVQNLHYWFPPSPFSDWFMYFIQVCISSYNNPPLFEFDVSELWSFVTWMRALLSFIWLGYLIVNVWLFHLLLGNSSLVNTLHLMVRFDTPSHSQFYSKKFCWLYPHDIFPLYIIK